MKFIIDRSIWKRKTVDPNSSPADSLKDPDGSYCCLGFWCKRYLRNTKGFCYQVNDSELIKSAAPSETSLWQFGELKNIKFPFSVLSLEDGLLVLNDRSDVLLIHKQLFNKIPNLKSISNEQQEKMISQLFAMGGYEVEYVN
jgi:hypothetical protein